MPKLSTERRNVAISTKEAFLIFDGWKDKQSVLVIVAALKEGTELGRKFSATS